MFSVQIKPVCSGMLCSNVLPTCGRINYHWYKHLNNINCNFFNSWGEIKIVQERDLLIGWLTQRVQKNKTKSVSLNTTTNLPQQNAVYILQCPRVPLRVCVPLVEYECCRQQVFTSCFSNAFKFGANIWKPHQWLCVFCWFFSGDKV